MLIVCPYPDCRVTYELDQCDPLTVVICSACGRSGSVRTLEIWQAMSNKAQAMSHPTFEREGCPNFAAIVEDVRSLFNVGSIFRTADGAGVKKLYLCGITGCPPHQRIEKASLGAEKYVEWEYSRHALDVLIPLKAAGVTVIGLETAKNSSSLSEVLQIGKLAKPLAFVVGNEVHGISPETLAHCDLVCHLPMKGKKESINVAVAFGIAAYFLDMQS